jgi:hypothetical protein
MKNWCFWQLDIDNTDFSRDDYVSNMKKSDILSTLDEFKNFIKDNPTKTCAFFRNGINPIFENPSNEYAYSAFSIKQQQEILDIIEKKGILNIEYVNGIYRTQKKISICTSKPDFKIIMSNLNQFGQAGIVKKQNNYGTNLLSTNWSIGLIKEWNFLTFQEYLTANSIEKIYQLFDKNGELNVNYCDKVTAFMPDSISENIRFQHHVDNRFIYFTAAMNITDAEKIQKYFVLSLLLSIFPKIPNISLAFYNYDGKYLDLGIYLTGNASVDVPVDRSIYRWPEDLALSIGHKLKEMILVQCLSSTNISVSITNAVPSGTLRCTDETYEYKKSKRILLHV